MLTQEQKEQLEAFAGLFMFTKNELLIIVGIPETENVEEINETIAAGKLKSKAKLYMSIFNLAYNGSSDAHKQVTKIIQDSQKKRY